LVRMENPPMYPYSTESAGPQAVIHIT
jgi:hypothetical protein